MSAASRLGIESRRCPADLRCTRDHQRYRRRALSEDEIARLLAASRADDDENDIRASFGGLERVPQTPMWLAFLETGARWGELSRASWGDVDLERRTLVLRAENTKAKRQRTIPLRKEFVEELRRLGAVHESVLGRPVRADDALLLSPEGVRWPWHTANAMRILDRVLADAGIDKVNTAGEKLDVHALRHSFGSRLARLGVGLAKVQRLMGHSDPKLTAQVYTHLDVEDLRDAVESIGDVG